MKVVILCGGEGLRLNNSLELVPKAMIKIGHRPMVWHVMKIYAKYGFTDFILALGKGGEQIRDYFVNYDMKVNDISVSLNTGKIISNSHHQEKDWNITMVDTGELAGTGARLSRCKKYLEDEEEFFLTYTDCLSNIDINKLLESHNKNQKVITVSGVKPPYRYGEFVESNDNIISWNEISHLSSNHGWVNGGFMVCNNKIFEYVLPFNECVIEKEVFTNLAKDQEVNIYKHEDFWQCLDNDREYRYLQELIDKNLQYWLF